MILQSGTLSQFCPLLHNLEKISKVFPTLLLLQVILISWSIFVQMWQWTIFSWFMGYDTWYLQKFQFCPFCSRWILHYKTLIFDFWECTLRDKLWTCEWTLGLLLSILSHILRYWLILRWKFPSGGFSRSKTLICTAEVLEVQMSCNCAIFCLILDNRSLLILVATLRY